MRRPIESSANLEEDLVPSDVLERCKKGDERAWAELVELTHRQVYTLCLRILKDPHDAAEATQDAYLKVWRGLKSFRGDARFGTWLYRVASNSAISRHRKRSRTARHEIGGDDELLAQVPAAGSTEGQATARIELGRLERCLAQLPDIYRAPLVLRDVYGLPMADIAHQLKISETAAKVRVHRGRKKLKDLIAQTEGPVT
ncbi:MAG TPA: RNA polymerase sigma factor [Actinomycetota bacterium]|nr:RNA polymerase sigma factor [Actinomycetota bacterium]